LTDVHSMAKGVHDRRRFATMANERECVQPARTVVVLEMVEIYRAR
jgi:hypothetical protein